MYFRFFQLFPDILVYILIYFRGSEHHTVEKVIFNVSNEHCCYEIKFRKREEIYKNYYCERIVFILNLNWKA